MLIFGFIGGFYMWLWISRFLPAHHANKYQQVVDPTQPPPAPGRFKRWFDNIFGTRKANDASQDIELESQDRSEANQRRGWRSRICNMSPDHDPELEVPPGLLIPTTIFSAVYCIFRAYILVEDIIGLRNLPTSAYATVEWSEFIPQI
jgi:hypothetical protein